MKPVDTRARIVLTTPIAALLFACTAALPPAADDTGSASAPSFASPSDAGEARGEDAGPDTIAQLREASAPLDLCAVMAAAGNALDEHQLAIATPLLDGGTPTTGMYDLVDLAAYTGPGGASDFTGRRMRSSLYVTKDTIQRATSASQQDGGSSSVTITGARYEVHGRMLVLTEECPSPATTTQAAFAATQATFALQLDATHIATYALR